MKRLAMLLLLGAFSFGVLQEATDAGCLISDDTGNCCVCICHTPVVGSAPSQTAAALKVQNFVQVEQPLHDRLVVKAIFNPPRLTA